MSYKILGLLLLLTSTAHADTKLGLVASMYYAPTASCNWVGTASATLQAFTTTAACPGPTIEANGLIGSPQTTDANLPQFTVNSLPAGKYKVTIVASVNVSGAIGDTALAINDGTTTSGAVEFSATALGNNHIIVVTAVFTYSASGNKTFALWSAGSATTTPNVANNSAARTTHAYIERVK